MKWQNKHFLLQMCRAATRLLQREMELKPHPTGNSTHIQEGITSHYLHCVEYNSSGLYSPKQPEILRLYSLSWVVRICLHLQHHWWVQNFPLLCLIMMSVILSYCCHSDKVQRHLFQQQETLMPGNFHYQQLRNRFYLFILYDIQKYLNLLCCWGPKFRQEFKSRPLVLYGG